MSLREIVESDTMNSGRAPANACTIARILATQPELGAELVELIEESKTGGITLAAIRRALLTSGVTITSEPLKRHRAGECRCGR